MNFLLKDTVQTPIESTVRDASDAFGQSSRRQKSSSDSVVAWVARGLVLASLLCTVWWFGGVDPAPKALTGVSILVALVLTLVRSLTHSVSDVKALWPMLSLVSGWLLWAWVQTLPLASGVLSAISPGVSQTIARFRDASDSLREMSPISVAPELTSSTLAWQSMVGLAFLLSALLFDSRKSRLTLLIVLSANSVLLASWGIIQRSTGTSDLLPGVSNPIAGSMPFGSFIYKNSGGAAMLLGIAAIVGLLTLRTGQLLDRMQSRKRRSRSSKSSANSGNESSSSSLRGSPGSDELYDLDGGWLQRILSRKKLDNLLSILTDPMVISIGFAMALALAGIASALSRGAWIGLATGGLIFVAGFLVKTRAVGSAIALVAVTLVAGMLMVVLFENNQKVMVRVEMLDGEVFRKDDRWNHWPAAMQSLAIYFPTGAGLGTYGYASLPFQENFYDGWYKQAHNQYLETAVESGVPGVVLMLGVLSLLAVWIVRLLASRESPERFAWGAIICVAAVGTAVQAIGDFVITTPANTLTFAILIGAASNLVYGQTTSRKSTHVLAEHRKLPGVSVKQIDAREATPNASRASAIKAYAAHPIAWCLIAIPVGVLSERVLVSQWEVHNLLVATEMPAETDSPTAESCRENIAKLQNSFVASTSNSRIQLQLGGWNELLYRAINLQSIISETKKPASLELWNATDLSTIFATLLALPELQRDLARAIYNGNESAKTALESATDHYQNALAGNPLLMPLQLKLVELAPLLGESYLAHMKSARKLSGVSSQQLFSVGLLANYANEVGIMNEAWSRSLEIDPRRLPTITELALKREGEKQVIQELYPDRASLLMSVSYRSDLPLSGAARAIALERATASLESDDNAEQLTESERMQLRATIAEMESKWYDAANIYSELIRKAPRAANIRFRYANALLQLGDTKNAWTQTNTGDTLSPADPQSVRLFQEIDRIKKRK